MANEPTAQRTHWILGLAQHFDPGDWPWLIRALHHDPLVWEALEKQGLAQRGLAVLPGDPGQWSPAVLGLLSLDLSAPLESLRSLPLRPVSLAVHERALKAREDWESETGSTPLNLGVAVLVALAFREARLGSTWEQVFQAADFSRQGWNTILSCLYGLIPDPFDMLRALMQPQSPNFKPRLVIDALLSNPLTPHAQESALRDLMQALSAAQRKTSLQTLAQARKSMAVEIAQEVLVDRLSESNLARSQAVSKSLPDHSSWSKHLDGLQAILESADYSITAGQEAQALPLISEAITGTRRIQAGLSAYLAELVSSIGNPESAVEAWRHAVQMEPENALNTAGLIQALVESNRLVDARTILDLHLAELDNSSPHPMLGLAAAQLAATEGHMQDARTAAEQVCSQVEQSPEILSERNLQLLAKTLLQTGLANSAEQVARRGIQNNPANPELLAIHAEALLRSGKPGPALISAHLAATLAPENIRNQELLLESLETSQEWQTALALRHQIMKRRTGAPTSAEWHALAGCALHAQAPREAITAAEKALAMDDQDGIAHALYGTALKQMGQDEAALSHFSTATELAPHKAEPWLALADAYASSDDPNRAYETLRSGSLAAPQSARLQLALGKASLEAGSPSQALSTLRKAASLLHENDADDEPIGPVYGEADLPHEVAFYLGETLRQLGHLDEANQVFSAAYQETRQHKSVDTRLAHSYAKTLLGLNSTAEAVQPLQDVVASDPAQAEPYVDLARSLLALRGPSSGYASQAVSCLQKALNLDLGQLEAQGLLGEALEADHLPVQALSAYQKALETNLIEDHAWRTRLHHGVGRVALQNGQAETALVSLREASQLEPLNPAIQQSLAATYLELGMYPDSLAAARTALQLNPAQTQLMAWFAQHARSLLNASGGQINALAEAGKVLTQAIQSDPGQIELYIDLGQLQLENGNQEAALRAFSEATDRSSQISLSLAQVLLLARQLRQLGEAEKAAILLTQSLQDYPGKEGYAQDQDRPETQLWYELSNTQLQIGNHTAAIQALDQAIICQPGNSNLRIKKVDLLVECSRLADASTLLQQLISETPDELCLHIKASFVQRGLSEYSGALAHAEHAISLLDNDTLESTAAKAYTLAAQISRSLLIPDKALGFITNADPDTQDQTALLDLLNTRFELSCDFQDDSLLAATIARLEELTPDDPRSLANLARGALRGGNLEQASQLLAQSLRWVPDDQATGGVARAEAIHILRTQAEAALELGKWSLAVPLVRHLVKQLPHEPLAQLQLMRALVMEAEVVPFARRVACIEHAPQAAAERNFDEFNTALALVEGYARQHKITPSGRSNFSLEALARWKGRGLVIFKPGAESSMALDSAFETLPSQPDDIAARIMMLGSIEELTAAGRAAQNYPRHPLVWSRQAAILMESNPHQALSAIHRALDNWGSQSLEYKYEFPMLLALQARLAYETGEGEQAASANELALSHWPEEARWHGLQAEIELDLALQIHINHNQRESGILSAIKHFEKAAELEPEEHSHALKLGQVYLWRGAPIQAIRSLERATQIAPEEAETWFSLAQAYRASGELDDARNCAEKSLEKNTDPTSAQILLAEIELDTNDARAAHNRIQAILEVHPEQPKALRIQALTLERMNRYSEALATFDRLIPLSQAPFTLELERARVLEKAQGAKASIEALKVIVERYPEEPLALAGLARSLLNDGQVEPAVEAAQKALVYNNGQLDQHALADLNQRIGHHALQAGQLDLALHHLSLAVELDPNNLEAYLDLGTTYMERRQHQHALQIFNQAVALAHNDYRPYYHAGLALKELKDYQAAEEMLNRASQLAPNEIGIHRLLTAVVALNLIHNRRSSNVSHYPEGLK